MSVIKEDKKCTTLLYELLNRIDIPPTSSLLHEKGPNISRKLWNQIGDLVSVTEKLPIMKSRSDQYITLRLDIRGMSTMKKELYKLGIFISPGFDSYFANYMIKITNYLVGEFNATLGYTQSDEITLLLSPSFLEGQEEGKEKLINPKFEYPFSGKRDKLVSLSASLASSLFNRAIIQDYFQNHSNTQELEVEDLIPLIQFDCRMGIWNTYLDALQVILWRQYDCGVNGISDAVYHLDNNKNKAIMKLDSNKKLEYLEEQKQLPLPPHQAYGTLVYKTKEMQEDTHYRTGKPIQVEHTVVTSYPSCNILNLLKSKNWKL